jgi:hypothetical protein
VVRAGAPAATVTRTMTATVTRSMRTEAAASQVFGTAALHGKRRFSLVVRPSQSSPDPSGSETERSQAEFWFWIIATSVGSATNAPAITAAASE